MSVVVENHNVNLPYAFLAHPPQKARPTQSPPVRPPSFPVVRRRSSGTSGIALWATHVQPGSPAAPSPPPSACKPCISPRRSSRRPSVTSSRVPSASFLFIETPSAATPSLKEFKPDLTALGYTYAVVPLPPTPMTAAPRLEKTKPAKSMASPPSPSAKKGGFMSLFKRPRAKSDAAPPKSPMRRRARSVHSPRTRAFRIADGKKRKYGPTVEPLNNEIALAQLLDGGSTEDNIRRLQHRQAEDASRPKNGGRGEVVVGEFYRDEQGGVWRDADEEMEFEHLLEGEQPGTPEDADWVDFDAVDSEHRGSVSSTPDSDLDPRYKMETSSDGHAANPPPPPPPVSTKPQAKAAGLSLLAIPARSRRLAPHLRSAGYVVDAHTFCVPKSPRAPKSPRGHPRGKARRRPTPLNLLPPATPTQCPTNSPALSASPRAAFLADNFVPPVPALPAAVVAPPPAPTPVVTPAPVSPIPPTPSPHVWKPQILPAMPPRAIAKKPSRMNVRAFFKRKD